MRKDSFRNQVECQYVIMTSLLVFSGAISKQRKEDAFR